MMESRSQFGGYDGIQLSYLNCWSLSITRWIQSHWKEDNQEPYPQEVYDHFRPDEKAENALLHFAPDFEFAIRQIERHLQATQLAWDQFLPDSGKPSARTWQRVLMESQGLQERIEKAIETISKGKKQEPAVDDRLVTAKQVAAHLGIERTSLPPKEKEWPKPAVVGKGNRPSQWRLSDLKPVLERQYPRDDWAKF